MNLQSKRNFSRKVKEKEKKGSKVINECIFSDDIEKLSPRWWVRGHKAGRVVITFANGTTETSAEISEDKETAL